MDNPNFLQHIILIKLVYYFAQNEKNLDYLFGGMAYDEKLLVLAVFEEF